MKQMIISRVGRLGSNLSILHHKIIAPPKIIFEKDIYAENEAIFSREKKMDT